MKTPIVILHGWQKKGEDYAEITSIFEKNGYRVFAPTLPGSEGIALPKPVMTINDYVAYIYELLRKQKIKKAIFIGHSFGGRISTRFAITHPEMVEKLVLTGAPLIQQQLTLRQQLFSRVAKLVKKIIPTPLHTFAKKVLYKGLGEWDYYKAQDDIKETFKAIIGEDQAEDLPKIHAPTLILWGGNDTFVGIHLGKKIANRIPSAIYKEIPNGSHKLPYSEPKKFAQEVLEFIK